MMTLQLVEPPVVPADTISALEQIREGFFTTATRATDGAG